MDRWLGRRWRLAAGRSQAVAVAEGGRVKRMSWLVIGVVSWTLLIGAVALVPPVEVLHMCGTEFHVDEAGCQRSIADNGSKRERHSTRHFTFRQK